MTPEEAAKVARLAPEVQVKMRRAADALGRAAEKRSQASGRSADEEFETLLADLAEIAELRDALGAEEFRALFDEVRND